VKDARRCTRSSVLVAIIIVVASIGGRFEDTWR
jgi:hypothetical protein